MEPDVRGDFTPQGNVLFTTRWKQLSLALTFLLGLFMCKKTHFPSCLSRDSAAKNQLKCTFYFFHNTRLLFSWLKVFFTLKPKKKIKWNCLPYSTGDNPYHLDPYWLHQQEKSFLYPHCFPPSSNIAWQPLSSSTLITTKLTCNPFLGWLI